jgi:amino acid transporter
VRTLSILGYARKADYVSALYPVAGAFFNYSVRFIDPAWGFAMGWNYAMNWLVVLPFELTAAGVTISFWTDPNQTGNPSVNVGVWVTIFLLLVVVINVFGVRGYGEVEFVLGLIKVIAVIGFIILGIIINWYITSFSPSLGLKLSILARRPLETCLASCLKNI